MYPRLADPLSTPDHGGGIDNAASRHGGQRGDWLDLSTGINPVPYPVGDLPRDCWTALPDAAATAALEAAARQFWDVPAEAAVLAAPGASSLIALLPRSLPADRVAIPGPTYNEHLRAFRAAGWTEGAGSARVLVHPNNPDGRLWRASEAEAPFCIIDESFCDVAPAASLVRLASRPGTVVLKSFGKFWGLAGLRLGFAIGDSQILARLAGMLGPWPVSGPALAVGARALGDRPWAEATRVRLAADAERLDAMVGLPARGTTLFRLYEVPDALRWQETLARHRIWSRTFPYSATFLRLGLPPEDGWSRLDAALREIPA